MKAKVKTDGGKVSIVSGDLTIATNFDKNYPTLPREFVNDGWHRGFPAEVWVKTYVNENVGEVICLDDTTGSIILV